MKLLLACLLFVPLCGCATFQPGVRHAPAPVQSKHHRVAAKKAKPVRAPVVVPVTPEVTPAPAPAPAPAPVAPKKRTFLGIPLVH